MDNLDIRQNILLQLPIDELISVCSTDELSQQICTSDAFWVKKFENEGLSIFNRGTNLEGWVLEYKYSLLCKQRTPLIMNIVKDPEFAYNNGALAFNIMGPFDLNVISVFGEIKNYFLSLFINKRLNPNAPRCVIYNTEIKYNTADNLYYIMVYDVFAPQMRYKYKLKITEEATYNMIYTVEYSGMPHELLNVPPAILNNPARNYGIGRIGEGRIDL